MRNAYVHFIRNRFVNKIMLTNTIIALLLFVLLTLIVLRHVTVIMKDNHNQTMQIVLSDLNEYTLNQTEFVRQSLKQIYLDQPFSDLFLDYMERPFSLSMNDSIQARRQLDNFMMPLFLNNMDLERIDVYRSIDGAHLSYTMNSIQSFAANIFYPVNRLAQLEDRETYIHIYPSVLSRQPNSQHPRVYTVAMNVTVKGSNRVIGLLSFDFTAEGFTKRLNRYTQAKGEFIVSKADGTVLYDSSGHFYDRAFLYASDNQLSSESRSLDIAGKRHLVNTLQSNRFGLAVTNVVGVDDIFADINAVNQTVVATGLAALMVCWVLNVWIATKFSNKVRYIVSAMKKIRSGQLSERIELGEALDELYLISLHFNKMCDEIQEYINKMYVAEIDRKNAELQRKTIELRALQSQINPHFLYNTLESIRMKAISSGDRDAGHMMFLLAKLLRNTIRGDAMIKVKDEIKNCKLYLELFQIRYKEKLHIEFDIEPNLSEREMIRNVLQPVIENYFVHGFNSTRDDNGLLVQGRKLADDTMVFTIEDNGLGIPPSIVDRINSFEHGRDGSGIGLVNVYERIQLMYGGRCGLRIHSKEGEGTQVILTLGLDAS